MSNQIVISSGAKVRELEGVLTGTAGIVSSVPLGAANGVATLDSGGKVPVSQLPSSVVTYLGTWDAATNTPTLTNGVGDAGDMYICNVAGTVNFGAGPITFAVGDWVLYGSGTWQKSNGQNGTVTSVGASITGNAIGLTGSPITTAGTLAFAFAGTAAQYINGAGNLVTFPSVITEAQRLITEVYNETGSTLTKGTVVYINGGHGNLPTVTKAIATGDSTSAQTYGVVQNDITDNNNGYVVVIGSLGDLDTQAYPNGTQLYLSSTTAGAWTSTKQYAPAHLVYVGIVVRSHPTQGVVEVRIQNGFELDELHNVSAQTPSNNQGLFYNSSTQLWENKSIATALGYTPANDALVVHLAGTETITGIKTFSNGLNTDYIGITGDMTMDGSFSLKQVAYGTLQSGYTNLSGQTNGLRVGLFGGYNALLNFSTSGSYTYTFPNATGTLALTTDIPSITGLVPYTGATGAVNLGTNGLTALSLTLSDSIYLNNNKPIYGKNFAGTLSYSLLTITTANKVLIDSSALGAEFGGSILINGTISKNIYTYTLPNATGTIALTSDLTGGTVTSVAALTIGTSGTDLSSTVANSTTTPVITLNVPTASATNRGALSSADWTTFNNKQSALTNPVTGTGTTNYLPKFTGTSTIGNSLVYDNGTNVGIGTTVPNIKFVVKGATNANTSTLGSGTIGNTAILESGGLYGLYIGVGDNGNTWLQSQRNDANTATYSIVLNPNGGNLGLGVTPSAWTSLRTALQIGPTFSISNGSNYYPYPGIIANNAYWDGSDVARYIQSSGASFMMVNAHGGGNFTWNIAAAGTAGNPITFTQAMTLTASGRLLLGTTTESTYKLDVNGTGRFSGALTGTSANFSGTVLTTDGFQGRYFRIFEASAQRGGFYTYNVISGAGTDYSVGLFSESTLWFAAGGGVTKHLTIASTGAATFSSSVTSNSLFQISPTTTTDNALYRATNGGGTAYIGLDNNGGGLVSQYALNIYHSGAYPIIFSTSAAERMRITSGGNVLIGTTTSAGAAISLQATSSAYSIWSINDATANYSQFYFGGTASSGYQFIRSDGRSGGWISLGTQDTERMRITSGGNVLIGTTTDSGYKLRVNGQIYADGNVTTDSIYPNVDNTSYCGLSNRRWIAVYAVNGTIQTSDITLKKNIEVSNLGLDYIMKLNPVSYNWKQGDTKKHYGLIAQEIEKEGYSIGLDKTDGIYGLNYSEFISPLIKATQELKSEKDIEIADLKAQIQELKQLINK